MIVADTDARARELAASFDLTFLRLRTGRPGRLPSPEEALAYPYTADEMALVEASRSRYIAGSPSTVKARLDALIASTGADELMVTSMVHSHTERLHSYRLLAELFGLPGSANQENGAALSSSAASATPSPVGA